MNSERRKFYGAVTVSKRGQIVIPVEARRDFDIEAGTKLLVFGDLDQGIGLATVDLVRRGITQFLTDVGPIVSGETEQEEDGDDDAPCPSGS